MPSTSHPDRAALSRIVPVSRPASARPSFFGHAAHAVNREGSRASRRLPRVA